MDEQQCSTPPTYQQYQQMDSFYKVSCSHCKKAHRPCDRKLPSCARCVEKGLQCAYHPPMKRKRQRTSKPSQENQVVKVMKSNGDNNISAKTALDTYFLHTATSAGNYCTQQFNSIPAIVSLVTTYGTDFDAKVRKAQWYNNSALILYHSPVKHNNATTAIGAHSISADAKRVYFRLVSLLNKEKPGDISKLEEITNNYSRVEVLDASEYLYNIAKQKILDPDLFVRIATDYNLAEICVGLCTYVLGKEGDMNEAKLYMSMFKVYVDNTRKILDLDVSVFTGRQREEMEKLKDKARLLSISYTTCEACLRQMELMRAKGTERLELFIEAMDRMHQMYPGVDEMKGLSAILRLSGPAERLTSFLQLCDSLGKDTRIWSEEERLLQDNIELLLTIRKVSFKTIKILAVYVEQDQPDCRNMIQLDEIKRSVTHEVIDFLFDNIEIYLLYGSFSYRVLVIAAENLLHQCTVNYSPISQQLSLLQKSKLLIDALFQKYLAKCLVETSAALESAIQKIETSVPIIIQVNTTTDLIEDSVHKSVEQDNADFMNEWLLQHAEELSPSIAADFFLDMETLDFPNV